MKIERTRKFSIFANFEFTPEEITLLLDSKWNAEKSDKLQEWVENLRGPARRDSMKGFLSFEITRRTQIECEEAFDDACHYIETVIDESAKKV